MPSEDRPISADVVRIWVCGEAVDAPAGLSLLRCFERLAGRSVADLPKELPLFVARAGQDQTPHLNETIDRFIGGALRCNLPITFANHATAPHAFDLMDDSETTREMIRQILAFMRFHLLGLSSLS